MDRDQLFLDTLADLRERVEAGGDYSLVKATALLRQLLLDREPLVDQVNRKHRIRLLYLVGGKPEESIAGLRSMIPELAFLGLLDLLHPSGLPPSAPRELLPKDRFLRLPVLFITGRTYTVRDLIEHAAHVLGGVHSGRPEGEHERVLAEFQQLFVGGQLPQIRSLRSISLVVLDALEPLREAVLASRAGSSPGRT